MDVILVPIIQLLFIVLDIYTWIVIASIVLSWLVAFNVINTHNRIVYAIGDFLYRMTEPVLNRIRQFMPNTGALDLSPMVLILGLWLMKAFLAQAAFKMFG